MIGLRGDSSWLDTNGDDGFVFLSEPGRGRRGVFMNKSGVLRVLIPPSLASVFTSFLLGS